MTSRQSCIASTLFRLYSCGLGVLMWFLGFHEGRSMDALVATFPEGETVLWLMLVFGVVGLLDLALNDTPRAIQSRPRFAHAVNYRHFGFAGLAFCHTCLVFIAVLKVESIWLAVYSLWNAVFIIGFSLLDAHQRAIDTKKEAVCRPLLN